jgi:sestrin
MDYELKPLDNFFDEYNSSYPFEKAASENMVKNMEKLSKIKLHELFLFWFPDQYFLYQKIFKIILSSSNGFIPITWKYYLGIMAASTMKCEFLFRYLEEEFLLNGGNEEWLIKGLEKVPEKLQKIARINNIIAHQPWKLNEKDIFLIYEETNQNMWNNNEIVEAILILVNFYRLATIIESIKLGLISPKSKLEEFEIFSIEEKLEKENSANSENALNFIEVDYNKNMLISILENFNENENDNDNVNIDSNNNSKKNQTKFNEYKDNNYINSPKNNSSFEVFFSCNEDFGKHISNYCTIYLDFDSHSQLHYSCLVNLYLDLYHTIL